MVLVPQRIDQVWRGKSSVFVGPDFPMHQRGATANAIEPCDDLTADSRIPDNLVGVDNHECSDACGCEVDGGNSLWGGRDYAVRACRSPRDIRRNPPEFMP